MLVKYYLSDNIKIPFENFTILSKQKKKKIHLKPPKRLGWLCVRLLNKRTNCNLDINFSFSSPKFNMPIQPKKYSTYLNLHILNLFFLLKSYQTSLRLSCSNKTSSALFK